MAQELQAGPVTLLQLLQGEREYVSPLFQRQYVWGEKEIEQLCNDVDAILDGTEETRFLGALVLEVKNAGLAFQPDSAWIVDGQQRLTTLYMALLRIALEAEKAGQNELSGSIIRQYLLNQNGSYRNKPKLLPTLLDYLQFNNLFEGMATSTPQLQIPFGDGDGGMKKAMRLISQYVKRIVASPQGFDDQKAIRLVSTLLEKLKFVQIVLGDKQDPHQVFDSLNAQGVRLENKDLIRNIVFQRVSNNPVEAEHLYNTEWIPLERELGSRFDPYFFPFVLVYNPSTTKSTLLAALRQRWENISPLDIVRDLRRHVACYNALTSPDKQHRLKVSGSEQIDNLLCRLHEMKAPTVTYPFILRIVQAFIASEISEKWTVSNLSQIESFLVRRSLAGFEPTGLHAVFKDLFTKTQGDPSAFVNEFDRNPTIQFPDDDQFANDIMHRPLYSRKLAPYILSQYERGIAGGDPHPDVKITIDHVMPQELTQTWSTIITEDEHKNLKDVWANLVPLSRPANSEKGAKPWSFTRDFFITETIFKTTKRLAHDNEQWGPTEIRNRSKHLAEWAILRWPRRA